MIEVITALGTIVGLLALAVKLLMTSWFKKSEELEVVKKKHNDQSQNRLDDELKILRSIVVTMQETVRLVSSKLDRTDLRVDELVGKLNDTMSKVDDFQDSAKGVIQNMIKSEFTEITKKVNLAKSGKS